MSGWFAEELGRHLSGLGRCPKCMRTAHIASLVSVVSTAILFITGVPSALLACSFILTGLLLGLWIAHLIAFAIRASRTPADQRRAAESISRRQFVTLFARSLAFAALATSLVMPAKAQSRCQNCRGCWNCCTCYYEACTAGCGTDQGCDRRCYREYDLCTEHCSRTGTS